MVNNYVLTNQLYNFMVAIPLIWNIKELEAMHDAHHSHKEYRGPNGGEIIFTLSILENEQDYIHVLVDASDMKRGEKVYGSSYQPLSTSFIWHKNGELDMPTESEIYEKIEENT